MIMLGQAQGVISLNVNPLEQGVDTALGSLGKLERNVGGGLGRLDGELQSVGLSVDRLGMGLLGAGTLLGAPLMIGIKNATELEQSFKNVEVALGDVSDKDLAKLQSQIQQIGADGEYSAAQIAMVAEALAKAGYNSDDLMSGDGFGNMMQAVSDLSSATGDGLDAATRGIVAAMATWDKALVGPEVGLRDASQAADILTIAANQSSTDLTGIIAGMRNLGPVAAQMGVPFDESAAAIALFTNNGLKGADAGISLMRGMQNLADPTSEAAEMMEKYGIAGFDAQGKFVGFPKLFDDLNKGLSHLDDQQKLTALSTIFGAEAMDVMGLAILQGGDPLRKLIEMMGESGIASAQAAERTNTLSGSLQRLAEGVGTALGALMQGWIGPIRLVADALDWMVSKFMSLPQPIRTAIGILAGLTAGALVLSGTMLLALPRILSFIGAVRGLATLGGPLGMASRTLLRFGGFVAPFINLAMAIMRVVSASRLLRFALGGIMGLASLGVLAYQSNFLGFGDWITSQVLKAKKAWNDLREMFGMSVNIEPAQMPKTKVDATVYSEVGSGPDGKDWFVLGPDGQLLGEIISSKAYEDGSITMDVKFADGTVQTLTQDPDTGEYYWGGDAIQKEQENTLSASQRFNKGMDRIKENLAANGFGFAVPMAQNIQNLGNTIFGVGDKIKGVRKWWGDFNTAFGEYRKNMGLPTGDGTAYDWFDRMRSAFTATIPEGPIRDFAINAVNNLEKIVDKVSVARDTIARGLVSAFIVAADGGAKLVKAVKGIWEGAGGGVGIATSALTIGGTAMYGLSNLLRKMGWESAADKVQALGDRMLMLRATVGMVSKGLLSARVVMGAVGLLAAGLGSAILSAASAIGVFASAFALYWALTRKTASSGEAVGNEMGFLERVAYSLSGALRMAGFEGAAELVDTLAPRIIRGIGIIGHGIGVAIDAIGKGLQTGGRLVVTGLYALGLGIIGAIRAITGALKYPVKTNAFGQFTEFERMFPSVGFLLGIATALKAMGFEDAGLKIRMFADELQKAGGILSWARKIIRNFLWDLLRSEDAMIGSFNVSDFLENIFGGITKFTLNLALDLIISFFEHPERQITALLLAAIGVGGLILSITGGVSAFLVLAAVAGIGLLAIGIFNAIQNYFDKKENRAEIALKVGILLDHLERIPILGWFIRFARFYTDLFVVPFINGIMAIREAIDDMGGPLEWLIDRFESLYMKLVAYNLLQRLGASAFLGVFTKQVGKSRQAVSGLEAAIVGVFKLLKLPIKVVFQPLDVVKELFGGTRGRELTRLMSSTVSDLGDMKIEDIADLLRDVRILPGVAGNTTKEFRSMSLVLGAIIDMMKIFLSGLRSLFFPIGFAMDAFKNAQSFIHKFSGNLDHIYGTALKFEDLKIGGIGVTQRDVDLMQEAMKLWRQAGNQKWNASAFLASDQFYDAFGFRATNADAMILKEYRVLASRISKVGNNIDLLPARGNWRRFAMRFVALFQAAEDTLLRKGGFYKVMATYFFGWPKFLAKFMNLDGWFEDGMKIKPKDAKGFRATLVGLFDVGPARGITRIWRVFTKPMAVWTDLVAKADPAGYLIPNKKGASLTVRVLDRIEGFAQSPKTARNLSKLRVVWEEIFDLVALIGRDITAATKMYPKLWAFFKYGSIAIVGSIGAVVGWQALLVNTAIFHGVRLLAKYLHGKNGLFTSSHVKNARKSVMAYNSALIKASQAAKNQGMQYGAPIGPQMYTRAGLRRAASYQAKTINTVNRQASRYVSPRNQTLIGPRRQPVAAARAYARSQARMINTGNRMASRYVRPDLAAQRSLDELMRVRTSPRRIARLARRKPGQLGLIDELAADAPRQLAIIEQAMDSALDFSKSGAHLFYPTQATKNLPYGVVERDLIEWIVGSDGKAQFQKPVKKFFLTREGILNREANNFLNRRAVEAELDGIKARNLMASVDIPTATVEGVTDALMDAARTNSRVWNMAPDVGAKYLLKTIADGGDQWNAVAEQIRALNFQDTRSGYRAIETALTEALTRGNAEWLMMEGEHGDGIRKALRSLVRENKVLRNETMRTGKKMFKSGKAVDWIWVPKKFPVQSRETGVIAAMFEDMIRTTYAMPRAESMGRGVFEELVAAARKVDLRRDAAAVYDSLMDVLTKTDFGNKSRIQKNLIRNFRYAMMKTYTADLGDSIVKEERLHIDQWARTIDNQRDISRAAPTKSIMDRTLLSAEDRLKPISNWRKAMIDKARLEKGIDAIKWEKIANRGDLEDALIREELRADQANRAVRRTNASSTDLARTLAKSGKPVRRSMSDLRKYVSALDGLDGAKVGNRDEFLRTIRQINFRAGLARVAADDATNLLTNLPNDQRELLITFMNDLFNPNTTANSVKSAKKVVATVAEVVDDVTDVAPKMDDVAKIVSDANWGEALAKNIADIAGISPAEANAAVDMLTGMVSDGMGREANAVQEGIDLIVDSFDRINDVSRMNLRERIALAINDMTKPSAGITDARSMAVGDMFNDLLRTDRWLIPVLDKMEFGIRWAWERTGGRLSRHFADKKSALIAAEDLLSRQTIAALQPELAKNVGVLSNMVDDMIGADRIVGPRRIAAFDNLFSNLDLARPVNDIADDLLRAIRQIGVSVDVGAELEAVINTSIRGLTIDLTPPISPIRKFFSLLGDIAGGTMRPFTIATLGPVRMLARLANSVIGFPVRVLQGIGKAVMDMGRNFDTSAKWLQKIFPSLDRWGTAGPRVALGIGLISVASFLWAKNIFGLKDAFGGVLGTIGEFMSQMMRGWKLDGLSGVFDAIGEGIEKALADIPATIAAIADSPAWEKLLQIFGIVGGMFIGGPLGIGIGLLALPLSELGIIGVKSASNIAKAWSEGGPTAAFAQFGREVMSLRKRAADFFMDFGGELMDLSRSVKGIPVIGKPLSRWLKSTGEDLRSFAWRLYNIQGRFNELVKEGMNPGAAAIRAFREEFPLLDNMIKNTGKFIDTFGGQIKPIFGALGDVFGGVKDAVSSVLEGDWGKAGKGLQRVGKGLTGLVQATSGLASSLAFAGLTSLMRRFPSLNKELGKVRSGVQGVFRGISLIAGGLGKMISGDFMGGLRDMRTGATRIMYGIRDLFTGLFGLIGRINWTAAFAGITAGWDGITNWIAQNLGGLGAQEGGYSLSTTVGIVVDWIITAVTPLWDALSKWIMGALGHGGPTTGAAGLGNAAAQAAGGRSYSIGEVAIAVANWAFPAIGSLYSKFQEWINSEIDQINWDSVTNKLRELGSEIEGAGWLFNSLAWVIDTIRSFFGGIQAVFDTLGLDAISDAISGIADHAAPAAGGLLILGFALGGPIGAIKALWLPVSLFVGALSRLGSLRLAGIATDLTGIGTAAAAMKLPGPLKFAGLILLAGLATDFPFLRDAIELVADALGWLWDKIVDITPGPIREFASIIGELAMELMQLWMAYKLIKGLGTILLPGMPVPGGRGRTSGPATAPGTKERGLLGKTWDKVWGKKGVIGTAAVGALKNFPVVIAAGLATAPIWGPLLAIFSDKRLHESDPWYELTPAQVSTHASTGSEEGGIIYGLDDQWSAFIKAAGKNPMILPNNTRVHADGSITIAGATKFSSPEEAFDFLKDSGVVKDMRDWNRLMPDHLDITPNFDDVDMNAPAARFSRSIASGMRGDFSRALEQQGRNFNKLAFAGTSTGGPITSPTARPTGPTGAAPARPITIPPIKNDFAAPVKRTFDTFPAMATPGITAMRGAVAAGFAGMRADAAAQTGPMVSNVALSMSHMRTSSVASTAGMGTAIGGQFGVISSQAVTHTGMALGAVTTNSAMMSASGGANTAAMASVMGANTLAASGYISSGSAGWAGIIMGRAAAMAWAGSFAGYQLSAGVAAGIDAGAGLVQAAASRIIAIATTAMAFAGMIHSPSRLTANVIGLPMTQGVGVGMTSSAAFRALDTAAEAVSRHIASKEVEAMGIQSPSYSSREASSARAASGSSTYITNKTIGDVSVTTAATDAEGTAAATVEALERAFGDTGGRIR